MRFLEAVRDRRKQAVSQAESAVFDLAVIGGGIHGATLCRQAAHCGLNTVLLESDDYAAAGDCGLVNACASASRRPLVVPAGFDAGNSPSTSIKPGDTSAPGVS